MASRVSRVAAWNRVALATWIPAAILILWQFGSAHGLLNRLFFPPPTALFAAFAKMAASGEFSRHLLATFTRALTGFAIGSFAGLLCGAAMGASPTIRRSFEPLISAAYSTPTLALLAIAMLLLGATETARISMIALGCFIVVAIQTLDGIRGVSRDYVELAASYGASRMMIVRKVYLPASLPQILAGLRLAVSRALVLTISIEVVGAPDGLGSLIWMAWQTFETEKLYIAVIATGLLGMLSHLLLLSLEARLIRWKN